jgi:hypothetical protein
MGGDFPRPEARKEMERYVERLRKIKLKKGRRKVRGQGDDPMRDREAGWEVKMSAASRAIGLRWLRMARDSVERKFKDKGERLREELRENLKKIQEEVSGVGCCGCVRV